MSILSCSCNASKGSVLYIPSLFLSEKADYQRHWNEFLEFLEFKRRRCSRSRSRQRSRSSSRRSHRASRRSRSRSHARRYRSRSRSRSTRSRYSPQRSVSYERRSESRSPEYSSGSPEYTEESLQRQRERHVTIANAEPDLVPPVGDPPAAPSEVQPVSSSPPRLPTALREALGTPTKKLPEASNPFHPELAADWMDVLELGFNQDWRIEARSEFTVPENCSRLRPPKLNVEVSSALPATCKDRDKRIADRQLGVAAGLVGLGEVISSLLYSGDDQYAPLIATLSKAARLFLDTYAEDVAIRRALALGNLNTAMRDTLKNTSWSEFLFGDKLTDDIKVAKQISLSASELKVKKPPVSTSKNAKFPPRPFPSLKTQGQGGQRTPFQRNQYQKTAYKKPRYQPTHQSRRRSPSRSRRSRYEHRQRSSVRR